jgi:hypothetical protein
MVNDQRSKLERIRDAIYDQTGEFTKNTIVEQAGNSSWHEAIRQELNRMTEAGLLMITCGRPKRYKWRPDE